jgi:Ni,Fe-hydrogenase III small subunit/ferredoxin-like protein FixX
MSKWVSMGLRTGVKTTRYPLSAETAAGVSPGRPCGMVTDRLESESSVIPRCPTEAIYRTEDRISVDHRRCIHCFRCTRGTSELLDHEWGYEWASRVSEDGDPSRKLGKPFARSIFVRLVDAGACRACLSEIEQLGKPYYNIHRLGFFMTPTPRHADVLLVAGPVTDNMRLPLLKAYDAMPTPKKVVAIGTCALSGGVFGPSFTSEAGVAQVIPVDVVVPGCPPPPLALVHGLLVVAGRKASAVTEPTELRQGRATE